MIPDKINFEFEGDNGHVLVLTPDEEGMTLRVFDKLEDTLDAIFYFKKDEWEFVNFIMNTHFKELEK